MSLNKKKVELEQVVILFAGDSGDGMQLTGSQFTNTSAQIGNDISTFPDFPAEIRAPAGTEAGVSGFQLHFGSIDINSPGDQCDVLVAMNAAAFRKNKNKIKPNGILIANSSGFDGKNLKLAKYEENPLENFSEDFQLYEIDILNNTKEATKEIDASTRDKDRAKNMYALGFVYWLYSRPLDFTIDFLNKKFKSNPQILELNLLALKAGYNYGEITDAFTERYEVEPAPMKPGIYRNISGNQALGLGLISAAHKANLNLYYSGYPITPASDILHFLANYKQIGVKTFQAEDEISAIASVIGASYAGDLAVTASSGPGISLKTEALGLGVMIELPLVVVNVQRGGPSTGLPTKTEQADLLQAMYGRNGEAPIPVLAAKSPTDCFQKAFLACKLAIEHMTPVILLSDGYLANGSEPWMFPKVDDLEQINVNKNFQFDENEQFQPYARNEKKVRAWAIPGIENLEHRVGGLEKSDVDGNVSYDPENHELMVKLRQEKINLIQNEIPNIQMDMGEENAKILILGWGSTFGSIKAAMKNLLKKNVSVANAQLDFLFPFPKNLGEFLNQFEKVIIPELNQGQLVKVIRDKFLIDAKSLTKTQGIPFTSQEIEDFVLNFQNSN